jgi:demethylmenaquinone methyltransferase/2-methoxy-6-polyprenyl-1,4-benzoquinol methylase
MWASFFYIFFKNTLPESYLKRIRKVVDWFSIIAKFYDRFSDGDIDPQLKALIGEPRGLKVFDAAGGTGRVAKHCVSDGTKIIVGDLSFSMLKYASAKPGLLPIMTSLSRLPFIESSFDLVLLIDALHHVQESYSSIAELIRILKPDGRLIIEEPDIGQFSGKLVRLFEGLLGMGSRFYESGELMGVFTKLKVKVSLINGPGKYWLVINKITGNS